MPGHKLETARLQLLPTSVHHAPLVFEHMSDERLWRFFPELRPRSVADLEAQYARWAYGGPQPATGERWENWICFLREISLPVGSVQATISPDGTASIAYAVYVEYQKLGFAREAAQAVIDHIKSEHAVRLVRADMHRQNTASVRVAESLGFVRIAESADEYVYELPRK